jgi:hypothetical protein
MDGAGNFLLKNACLVRLWLGRGLSFVGDSVSTVALVLLVVDLSGSASAVGGASWSHGCCRCWRARSSASSPTASTVGPCSSREISSGRSSSSA